MIILWLNGRISAHGDNLGRETGVKMPVFEDNFNTVLYV